MKERFCEAIRAAEVLTAGRFYNRAQKETIIRLVAGSYLLTEKEADDLCAFCTNPDYEYCDSLLGVRNGLVFLSGKKDAAFERALLEARKDVLTAFEQSRCWEDREGWIRYIRSGSGFEKAYERALFQYAMGRKEEAEEIFVKYAADCHTLSVRFCIALARECGDEDRETRLLTMLKKVYEELQYLDFPAREQARLNELCEKGFAAAAAEAGEKSVHYFDANGRTIGFGV